MLAVYVVGVAAIFVFVLLVKEVFLPLSAVPPERSDLTSNVFSGLIATFLQYAVLIPTLIATLAFQLATHIQSNAKLYFVLFVAAGIGTAYVVNERQALQTSDAVDTSVWRPAVRAVWLKLLSFLRILYDLVVPWLNLASGLGTIIRNVIFELSRDCVEMDWGKAILAILDFANAILMSVLNFIASGFTDDLTLTPGLNAIADFFSALQPAADCQCKDLSPLWDLALDPTDGIIQSKNLHNFIDTAFMNMWLEYARVHTSMWISIFDQAVVPCATQFPGNTTEIRKCKVSRAPDYSRSMDKTCAFFTHGFGFIDDVLDKFVNTFTDYFDVAIEVPRLGSVVSPFLCYMWDIWFIFLDALLHIDLFFTLPMDPGNYWLELDFKRPYDRLYNVSYNIEEGIGAPLSIYTDQYLYEAMFLVAEPLNITFALTHVVVEVVRYSLAVDDYTLIASFLQDDNGIVKELLNGIERDTNDLADAIQNIGDEINEALGQVLGTVAQLFSDFANLILSLISHLDDLPGYINSGDLATDTERVFNHSKAFAIAVGNFERQFAFGYNSGQCTLRALYDANNPTDIDEIPLASGAELDLMCVIANFVEAALRLIIAIVEYVIHSIVSAVTALTPGGPGDPVVFADVQVWLQQYLSGGALDMEAENGLIPISCLLLDQSAGLVPSMLNIGSSAPTCPQKPGRQVATAMWRVFKRFGRLALLPLRSMNLFMRYWAYTVNGFASGFSDFCDEIIKSFWLNTVVPTMDFLAELFTGAECVLPTSAATKAIGEGIRYAFVDTSGSDDSAEDCNTLPDGGLIIDGLCSFIEFLQQILDIVIDVFVNGFEHMFLTVIENWLDQLIANFTALFNCIWGTIRDFFTDGFGCIDSCFSSGFTDCDCSFSFGEDCEALINSFKPEIPTGHSTSPPATSTTPTPTDETPYTDIRGACCRGDGVCLGGSSAPVSGNSCFQQSLGLGVGVLMLGQQCSEQSVCDGAINSTAVETGACCNPDTGCVDLSYNDCVALNGTGGVYIPGEKCSAVDNTTCNVELPAVEDVYLGCCATESSASGSDIRGFVQDVSAHGCWELNGAFAQSRAYYAPGDANCSVMSNSILGPHLINSTDAELEALHGASTFTNVTTECCSPNAYIGTNIYVKYQFLGCRVARPGASVTLTQRTTTYLTCPESWFGATSGGYDYTVPAAEGTPQDITGDSNSPGLRWTCRGPVGASIYTGGECSDFVTGPDASYYSTLCTPWADYQQVSYSPLISEAVLQSLTTLAFYPGPEGTCPFPADDRGRYWGIAYSAQQPTYRIPYFRGCPADDADHMHWLDVLTAKVADGYPSGGVETSYQAIYNHTAIQRWKTMHVVYFENPAERPEHAPPDTSRVNTDPWCNAYYHEPDATVVPDELPPAPVFTPEASSLLHSFARRNPVAQSTRRNRLIWEHEDDGTASVPKDGPAGEGEPPGGIHIHATNSEGKTDVGMGTLERPHYWQASEEQRTAHYSKHSYLTPYIDADRRGGIGVRNTMQVNATNMTLFSANGSNPRHPCHPVWKMREALRNAGNDTAMQHMVNYMSDRLYKECLLSTLIAAAGNVLLLKPDYFQDMDKSPIHPLFLYDTTIGFNQLAQMGGCWPVSMRYVGLRLQRDPSVQNVTWEQYLEANGGEALANSSFCHTMGLFSSMFANDTLARQTAGEPMPGLLGPFNLFSRFSKVFRAFAPASSAQENATETLADTAPDERKSKRRRLAERRGTIYGETYEGFVDAQNPLVTEEDIAPWLHLLSPDKNYTLNGTRIRDPPKKFGPIEYLFLSTNWSNYNFSRVDWQKMNRTRFSMERIVQYSSLVAQHKMALHGMVYTAPISTSGSGSGIDPGEIDLSNFCISGECVDCPVVTNTIADVIELILINVDDLQDQERYLPNATSFSRNTDFFFPDDANFCKGIRLEFEDEVGAVTVLFDVTSFLLELFNATEQDARVLYGEWACFFWHHDVDDPTTLAFWFNFARTCDVFTGPSCTRGRAGSGLFPSLVTVAKVFVLITIVVGVTGIPLPITYIWVLFPFAWMATAYFMSPLCLLPGWPVPLPQLPLCLADDIYQPIAEYYADECTDFEGLFPGSFSKRCAPLGRTPIDCTAHPYNADISGVHTLVTSLYLIDPDITDYLRETENPFVSWIREINIVDQALNDVQDITDDNEALGCTRRWYPSLPILFLILLLGAVLILLAFGLLFALLMLFLALYVYLISLAAALAVKLATIRVPVRGTYRVARRSAVQARA